MADIVGDPTVSRRQSETRVTEDTSQQNLNLGGSDVTAALNNDHEIAALPIAHDNNNAVEMTEIAKSLRYRTVPRARRRGAVAGPVVTAAVAATAGGIVIAAGKGAVIGAALGTIVPGAGTAVGAVVGGLIGLAIGTIASGAGWGIGHVVAGGTGRDKAEKAIFDLANDDRITPQEALRLKNLSTSELKKLGANYESRFGIGNENDRNTLRKLVMVLAAKKGAKAARAVVDLMEKGVLDGTDVITATARDSLEQLASVPETDVPDRSQRDLVRQAVMLTAIKRGTDAATFLKGQLLLLGPSGRAGTAAQNSMALEHHFTSRDNNRVNGIRNNQIRFGEYHHFMQDAVAAKSRAGETVSAEDLTRMSNEALDHLDKFQNDNALRTFQQHRRAFDNGLQDMMSDLAQNKSPDQLLPRLQELDQLYGRMAQAEGLGMGAQQGANERTPRYEAAIGRAAARAKANGQDLARHARTQALAN
ncbi:MAG: hypothetical protein AAF637_17905, partial [Pseudomonadota bacterium]